MADRSMSSREALAFLIGAIGGRRLTVLAILLVAASLTEGIGLILLVPLTQLVTGGGAEIEPNWLRQLAGIQVEMLLAGFVVLVSLRALLVYLASEQRRSLGLWLGRKLRQQAHTALMAADWKWLSRQHSAEHSALVMSEADRVAGLANQALVILTALVTLAILLTASAMISLPLTLAVAGLGLLVGVAVTALKRRQRIDGRSYVAAHIELQKLVSNGLAHLRAARIADAESLLAADFEQATGELADIETRYFRTGHRTHVIFQIAAVIMLAALVYLAVVFARLPLTVFVPVLAIAVRIVPLVGAIQQGIRSWSFDLPAMENMLHVIQEAGAHVEHREQSGARVQLGSSLELHNIEFIHDNRIQPLFGSFNLAIGARSITAVTGPSGSGKSTLADLLSGLVAPDRGELLIDGVALDAGARVRWRREVAYVEQSPFMRETSIAENLAWGSQAVSENAMSAALAAASAEFVHALPDGLQTVMGESGRNFSGGEKQRIALARALIRRPQLLILDEVTAGLDEANTLAVLRSIEQLKGSCTILLLGHDPRMLELADQVVRLGGALEE